MLSLDQIVVKYGEIETLHGISINVDDATIVTLIGSNGAGKSTTLKAIVGLVPLVSGKILFKGERTDGLKIHERVKMGIAICPEGRRVFPKMTVYENLKMGAFRREWREGKKDLGWIYQYFPVLGERGGQLAGSLSGGQQQMLALGRALMANPKLLLLDEPSLGIAPRVVLEIAEVVRLISQQRQVAIILVEQNSKLALKLAKKGYVLEMGCVVLEGTADELLNSESVKQSYLGG